MQLVPPNYGVALRISHPQIDPAEITLWLNLHPYRAWKVGSQKCTPTGILLDGKYASSYWCYIYEIEEECSPNEKLEEILVTLLPQKKFFESIHDEGGISEIYFTLRVDNQSAGDTIKFSVLENFVKLKFQLSIEVFPRKKDRAIDTVLPPPMQAHN